jgi:hypothetical protein
VLSDRQTDGQTDRQTDRHPEDNISHDGTQHINDSTKFDCQLKTFRRVNVHREIEACRFLKKVPHDRRTGRQTDQQTYKHQQTSKKQSQQRNSRSKSPYLYKIL